MSKLKVETEVLVSTRDSDTEYHDDMYGESVWFNAPMPDFFSNYDWREFNGIKISKIVSLLKGWSAEDTSIESDRMRELLELRKTNNE